MLRRRRRKRRGRGDLRNMNRIDLQEKFQQIMV